MTLRLQPNEIEQAAKILREGGTVAFPTETVYGLGANALDASAIAKIFAAKGRPSWDPLIVHVSDQKMLAKISFSITPAEKLIQHFWPGPLTLLLPRTAEVPDAITAGRPLVGVRMPSHPLALALIRAAGVPIAAPSANRFGHTSPTTADHVLEDLDGRIDAVLDGGPTTVGVESTVLDPNQNPHAHLSPRSHHPEMIERVAGPVRIFQPAASIKNPASLPSPGVGIRHYAPRAKLILVASEEELRQQEERIIKEKGEKIGILLPQGWTAKPSTEVFPWAAWDDGEALAQRLFAGLRELDTRGVTVIICPLPEASGVGLAIRDRLEKAARTK